MSKPRATAAGKSQPSAGSPEKAAASTPADKPKSPPSHAIRETVESIAIAVVLAFLFRAFVAEAFVIPTGSMAPTLMGQHKDVECPECGFWYQAGASIEIDDEMNAQRTLEGGRLPPKGVVVATTCPLCRYRQVLDWNGNANQKTFSGDRILVSKFIYDFTSPQRWDVIVFKYPFNAKQNFIKRLVGLPNETILIKRGDVFVKQPGEDEFTIARKPDRKLEAMLQLVDDTRHVSKTLSEIGWPLRWQGWSQDGRDVREEWATSDGGHTYSTAGKPGEDRWLRYRHIVPSFEEWRMIEQGERPVMPEEIPAELITDFYAYNAFTSVDPYSMSRYDPRLQPEQYARPLFGSASLHPFGTLGLHWVGTWPWRGRSRLAGTPGSCC
jgi:signal peptidase I